MRLAETRYDNARTGCCAPVDPAHWEGRRLVWKDEPFLKDHIRALFHVPLDFGRVMGRDHRVIEAATAWSEEPFWLTDEVSPWGSDVYVHVDRDVPGAHMETLSGTFVTKAFEGPYRDAPRWVEEMTSFLASRGERVKKLYFFYATCPDCAKKLGKNQVVLFAQV